MRTLGALLVPIACAFCGYAAAVRMVPGARTSTRLAAGAVLGQASLILLFFAATPFAAFSAVPAVAVWLVLATAAWLSLKRHPTGSAALAEDVAAFRVAWRELGPVRWIVAVVALAVGARVLRGLVAPPLAWDSLTYHLPKAARWIQASGFVGTSGPDAARYYDHFPPYGEILWAWAMVVVRGDALLSAAQGLVWAAIVLAGHACARELGASRRNAALAALGLAAVPAVASWTTSAYVDDVALELLLLGCVFVVRALRPATAYSDAALAGLAFGLLAGTKTTGVLLAPIAVGALLAARGKGWRPRLAAAGVGAAATAIGLPPYLRAALATGNALYPITWTVAGRTILPGNGQLDALLRSGADVSATQVLSALLSPAAGSGFDCMSFGPGAVALAALGLVGAARLVRGGRAVAVAVLLAFGATMVLAQAGAGTRALWTSWVGVSPRLVTGALAVAAILAASVETAAARVLLGATAVSGALLSRPTGVSGIELEAILAAVPGIAVIGAGAVMAALLARRARWRWAAAVAVAASWAALGQLDGVRATRRHPIYAAAARRESYDPHVLSPDWAAAAPVWAGLDGGAGHRLAVTAGWDGVGHNWYTYPLLGSRLQNEIVYVPPTRSGRVLDYADADALSRELSVRAWLGRLASSEVEFVVALAPPPPEAFWILQAPDVFELAFVGSDGQSAAFRFRRDRAAAFLERLARPGP